MLGQAQGFDSGQEGFTAPDPTYSGPGVPLPAWGSNALTSPTIVHPPPPPALAVTSAPTAAAASSSSMSTEEMVVIGVIGVGVLGVGAWLLLK